MTYQPSILKTPEIPADVSSLLRYDGHQSKFLEIHYLLVQFHFRAV